MRVAGLDIAIKKSNRKTVSIFIERDGSVSARVPETLNAEQVESVLKTKEYQIHKNRAVWTQLNETATVREYVSGQSFLYLGRNYRLSFVDERLGELQFVKGRFLIGKDEKENAKDYFIDFYKKKLKEKVAPFVSQYKERMGVNPNEVKVIELKNRWASCSPKGNIHFHWKCAMAPIDVLQYIVVHELAHLIHLNHTADFWNEVDKVLPNYDKRASWLKVNGAGMDL